MLTTCSVDDIVLRKDDEVFFHYVFGDDRPYVKEYKGFFTTHFQTIDGRLFIQVDVKQIDSKEFNGIMLFSVNNIVCDSFNLKRKGCVQL